MKNFSISAFAAVFISLALFWLMQFMISNNQHELKDTKNIQMTEFIRLIRNTQQETLKNKAEDTPPPPEKRPSPPPMSVHQVQVAHVNSPTMAIPSLNIPLQSKGFSGAVINKGQASLGNIAVTGKISTNLIPLVRIPPRYPMRAANRRIEGWVKVEFTITKEGTVKDPTVVASQPNNVFNRAAIKAIRRWKFKAKVINNEAFEQRAVQTLQFKLSK